MKNTLGERYQKFRVRKGLNSHELSKALKVSPASLEYIEDGKTKNPGIQIFEKSVKILDLNPYDLYELITGEVYTEKPQGSVTAKLEAAKKEIEKLEKDNERLFKILENFSENIYITSPGTGRSVVELGKTATKQHIINSPHIQQEEIYGVPVEVEKEKPPDQALH